MARIRTIKPEFWTSEQVVDCSPTARLLFIGLWNFCDDGGVHPDLKRFMYDKIREWNAEGVTIILVSHDMPVVVELCPRSICMNAGAIIADAPTREVLSNERVIEAYLGGHAA